jgi:hypothetical protein
MNSPAIADFVTQWVIVNVAAMIVLAVLSYISSVLILDWLASLDRWMYARRHKGGTLGAENRDARPDDLSA